MGAIGSRFNHVSGALADHERELEQYREIVERVDDPIKLQDREGNYLLLNDAVTDLAGLPEEELVGEDESLFMDDRTVSLVESKKAAVLETERPVEYEISPESVHTGGEATFSVRRYPSYDETGSLAGSLAICRDVTSLKERETGRAIEDLYHGSGLGLWMVYWIVQRSGGSITVRDGVPRGTEIEITLPLDTGVEGDG